MNIKISDGQRFAILKLLSKFTKIRDCRLFILSNIPDKKILSTSDLTIEDWRKIRNMAYLDWVNDTWDISDDFKQKAQALVDKYETDIMGQKTLF